MRIGREDGGKERFQGSALAAGGCWWGCVRRKTKINPTVSPAMSWHRRLLESLQSTPLPSFPGDAISIVLGAGPALQAPSFAILHLNDPQAAIHGVRDPRGPHGIYYESVTCAKSASSGRRPERPDSQWAVMSPTGHHFCTSRLGQATTLTFLVKVLPGSGLHSVPAARPLAGAPASLPCSWFPAPLP